MLSLQKYTSAAVLNKFSQNISTEFDLVKRSGQ